MKYHPDRNAGDKAGAEKKFKEVRKAYDIISDPQKRSAYDQFGHAGVEQGGQGFGGGNPFGGAGGFGDIFGDIFGGGRSNRSQVFRGADLGYELNLDLEKAISGDSITIEIPTQVSCDDCSGNGTKKGSQPSKCGTCDGVGQVRMQQGFFSIQQPCPKCQGNGTVITDPCPKCHGGGRNAKTKTLSVKVPPGVDNGDRIRLSGEGEAGENGAPPGDLYVQVHVREHDIFKRDGNNLYCEVPLSFTTAALGGELEVPTLDGKVKLKISPETQTGRMFRLRGKGVKSVRSGAMGDLMCKVVVETPVNLSSRQKELLQELEESMGKASSKHSPKAQGFFDGVKKFFDDLTN